MVQAEEMFSFLMHRTFPFQQDAMSDEALEALSVSLGSRKPEPELDLSSIKEVDEVLTLELVIELVSLQVMKLNAVCVFRILTQLFFIGDKRPTTVHSV